MEENSDELSGGVASLHESYHPGVHAEMRGDYQQTSAVNDAAAQASSWGGAHLPHVLVNQPNRTVPLVVRVEELFDLGLQRLLDLAVLERQLSNPGIGMVTGRAQPRRNHGRAARVRIRAI